MTQTIPFTKMHGCGNDYIYVNAMQYPIAHPDVAAIAWSDRRKGIGSDGLVLIGAPDTPEADFTMRIFNADGSEAMMCGNASRCIGKYVYERGLTHKTCIGLSTRSGMKKLNLHLNGGTVERVSVDMGVPALANDKLFMPSEQELPQGVFVDMGNPHYVIFVDDVDAVDVATEGQRLEHHACFPQRCNIEFAEVRPNGIRMRVWERGSGITMACGTGACATAVAARMTQRSGTHSHIVMDGGTLDIEWRPADRHIYMTGPATFVFDGAIETDNP